MIMFGDASVSAARPPAKAATIAATIMVATSMSMTPTIGDTASSFFEVCFCFIISPYSTVTVLV